MTGASVVPPVRPRKPATTAVTETRPSGRRNGVSCTSAPRSRSRSIVTTRRVSRPREAVSRSPSSVSVKFQSTSNEPAAPTNENEEDHGRRERRNAERMGGKQAARGILGSLDESAGKIVQEIEGDADDRQRGDQIAQARDPAERERPRSGLMKDRGTRLDGGAGSEQHGPQHVRLAARDGREGQLRLRAASGRGLHLDLDETEQAVKEGRRDVDAADAIERDRAHVPAEDARAQLQPPTDDEVAEPQPGQHRERNAEQERGEEQRDENLRPQGDQQRDERDQARADEAPRDREQRQRVEPALEHRLVARLHAQVPSSSSA